MSERMRECDADHHDLYIKKPSTHHTTPPTHTTRAHTHKYHTHQESGEVEAAGDREELRPLVKGEGLPGQETVLGGGAVPIVVVAVVIGQLCVVCVVCVIVVGGESVAPHVYIYTMPNTTNIITNIQNAPWW